MNRNEAETMPIRIMHVVDHLGKGGLENGLVNLIHGLDPARFEHVVYAIRKLGPNADRLPRDRVQVICQGKQETDSPIQIGALARAIRKIKPDIVHSRNWAAVEAVLAGRWVRLFGPHCALVQSEHGLETGTDAREPWRRVAFRRMAFELADRVLAVSGQLGNLHARRTGFRADRITVVHNGVDGRRFYPDPAGRARMRAQLGIAENEFLIGCVGNLLPVKDHLCVLQAVAGLTGRNWRLVIAGEGPERPKLESFLASNPEWKSRVSLMGTCEQVPELLNAFDVYVLSSLSEGISNSLLEAMSSGIPAVATDTGGNPEVVVDGESGLLFPVGDPAQLTAHLARLEAQPELRRQLGGQALVRMRAEFSIDSMVRQYARIYESLGRRTAAAPAAVAAGI